MDQTAQPLYRMKVTPVGRQLTIYMAAILDATGMNQGKPYSLKKFFSNFATHLDAQRIFRVEGGYQLTPKGRDYFRDRLSSSRSRPIMQEEVDAMKRRILEGGSDLWTRI